MVCSLGNHLFKNADPILLASVEMDNSKEKWQRPLNINRWYQQMSLHGLEFGDEFRVSVT